MSREIDGCVGWSINWEITCETFILIASFFLSEIVSKSIRYERREKMGKQNAKYKIGLPGSKSPLVVENHDTSESSH